MNLIPFLLTALMRHASIQILTGQDISLLKFIWIGGDMTSTSCNSLASEVKLSVGLGSLISFSNFTHPGAYV